MPASGAPADRRAAPLSSPRSSPCSRRSPPGRSTGRGRSCCWSSWHRRRRAAIATVAWRRAGTAGRRAARLAVAFLVLGVPLAVPSRLGAPPTVLRPAGLADGARSSAWKDLVTVDLPVGSYRNLLVPALVVFLVGTCPLLLVVARRTASPTQRSPSPSAMVSFGLFFGRTDGEPLVAVGPVTLAAPVETALGLAALLVEPAVAGLAHARRAVPRAAACGRIQRRARLAASVGGRPRRTALGAGMLAVAVVAAAVVVPRCRRGRGARGAPLGDRTRDRARRGGRARSPSIGRCSRTRAPTRCCSRDVRRRRQPERVRAGDARPYDGEVYRSGGSGAWIRPLRAGAVRARRRHRATPSRRTSRSSGLDGIWMPTAGSSSSVDFAGPRAAALADRFYYSAAAAAGVQTAGGGLEPGDSYGIDGVEPATPRSPRSTPRAAERGRRGAGKPARVGRASTSSGTGGAALAGLVTLLRERGYLSHGLSRAAARPRRGSQTLPDYRFQPSASGHSLARIDALFRGLLRARDRSAARRHPATTSPRSATTSSSPSRWRSSRESSGFPSRVVVGARLASGRRGLPACDGRRVPRAGPRGVDRGAVLRRRVGRRRRHAAVRAVAEPRGDRAARPRERHRGAADSVEEVVAARPRAGGHGSDDSEPRGAGLDLAWLWPRAADLGIGAARPRSSPGPVPHRHRREGGAARSRRQAAPRPRGSPAAGTSTWMPRSTRDVDARPTASPAAELAGVFATPSGAALADAADRAVFSGAATPPTRPRRTGGIVDAERRRFAREAARGNGFAATVSLRSFVRHLAPARVPARAPPRGEKRRALRSPCASHHDRLDGTPRRRHSAAGACSSCSTSGSRSRSPRCSASRARRHGRPGCRSSTSSCCCGSAGCRAGCCCWPRPVIAGPIAVWVVVVIACHRIGASFGCGPGMTVLAAPAAPGLGDASIGFGPALGRARGRPPR